MTKSYKLKLAGGKLTGYYANKSDRIQHFPTDEAAKAKRKKEGLKGARVEATESRKKAAQVKKVTKKK